ncbi:MAG: hypothetical protein KGS73_06105 [Chloroflexi bacterium]|nr:hypothetical protein [Chloroflexota bacterium]
MPKALVALDTDRIKRYIFRSSSLKEIRGASAILDKLNRQLMPELMGGEVVYANGGSGLFVVDSTIANERIEAVQHLYQTTTHGATITGAMVDIPQNREDVQVELMLLRHRLRLHKSFFRDPVISVTHPLFRYCSACGVGYGETETGTDSLCRSCLGKRQEDAYIKKDIARWIGEEDSDPSVLWGRLIRDLTALNYPFAKCNRPEDFNELGNVSSPSGYMGLIYADGNGMGNEIERITKIDEFRRFSEAVDTSIYDAVAETIATYLCPNGSTTLPFDILLLGGDDLVMVTAADQAIKAAMHIVERFGQLTAERLGRPLTLSASVTLSHVNYPIGPLIHLADTGLKFAKREASRRRLGSQAVDSGLINFLVVSSSNHLDFGQYYKEVLQSDDGLETLVRTCRPYTVSGMRRLLNDIDAIRSLPRGKLEQLRSAVFKSRRQGNLDAMMAVLRLRNNQQREALLSLGGDSPTEQVYLPWIREHNRWVTRVLDVVELLDFIH